MKLHLNEQSKQEVRNKYLFTFVHLLKDNLPLPPHLAVFNLFPLNEMVDWCVIECFSMLLLARDSGSAGSEVS